MNTIMFTEEKRNVRGKNKGALKHWTYMKKYKAYTPKIL